MVREQEGVKGVQAFLAVVGQAHVFLLVHGLEFGVEAAEDAVHEAVGLDLRPVFDLVGRNLLHVAGHVVGRVGIGPFGADDGHQLVIFVRNGNLGCLVTDGVDLVIKVQALLRVREGAVYLEQAVDGFEQRFFSGIVLRAELFGTLEHHVLQVVGEAGVVGRIVFAASPDGDIRLDAGFVLIDGHVHFQAVLQGVDFRVERIAGDGFILGTAGGGHGGQSRQEKDFLHIHMRVWNYKYKPKS